MSYKKGLWVVNGSHQHCSERDEDVLYEMLGERYVGRSVT